jgi:hypothetical protein
MTAIAGILFKVTCEIPTPTTTMQDKSRLLTTENNNVDDMTIIEYIQLEESIKQLVHAISPVSLFFFCNSIEDTEFFYWINLKQSDYWNDVTNNNIYKNDYLSKRQTLWDQLHWVDHGYKIMSADTPLDWLPKIGHERIYHYSVFSKNYGEQMWANSNYHVQL